MSFTKHYDTYLFDCDGVIWRGNKEIPGASDVLNHLLSINKRVIFVTNNTSKTRVAYRETFKTVLGLTVLDNQVYSAGITAALYVKRKLRQGEKIFLIGSKGLTETMDENGIEYIGYSCDMDGRHQVDFANYVPESNVKFVVGAFDGYFNYAKMAEAFIYIKECGAEYIATNIDMNHSLNDSRILPGTGAVLEGLTQSIGIQPKVLGKPSSIMFDMISADHNIQDKSKVLMIGDTLPSDIQFGINSGVDTALVLSGITTKDMIVNLNQEAPIKPTFVLDSIADLLK